MTIRGLLCQTWHEFRWKIRYTLAPGCARGFNLGAVRNSHHRYYRIARSAGGIGKATRADVGGRSAVDCDTAVGYILPADGGISQYEMHSSLTRPLQATATPPVSWTGIGNVIVTVAFRIQSPVAAPDHGRQPR
jgi:hypothetical protein